MLSLVRVLIDRVAGLLVGQRCDLCREWTLQRIDEPEGLVTWCLVCFASELRRHGL